jgi:pimeloyl-ACP methyl ester carboxylesterase
MLTNAAALGLGSGATVLTGEQLMNGGGDDSESLAWTAPGFLPPPLYGEVRDRINAGTHFRIDGDGPAVVLIHGVGLDLEMWAPQVAALAGRYTVIRYDMLGHGGSAKPPGDLRLASYVAQLDMLHRYFRLGRSVVIGFSMGALVARAFATVHPERLAGLVLLNGVYDRSTAELEAIRSRLRVAETDGPEALIEAALARWLSPEFRAAAPDMVATIETRLRANDRHGFLAAYRVFIEADEATAGPIDAISCPALVATGEKDLGSTPAMTAAMAGAIPNAELHVLPGLAHLAPIEGADEVNALLLGFLDRLD